MTIHFGARIKIPLNKEHLPLFKKDVSDDGQAGIIHDGFGDYLVVNTNHASDNTHDDQEYIFFKLKDLIGYFDETKQHELFKENLQTVRRAKRETLIKEIQEELYTQWQERGTLRWESASKQYIPFNAKADDFYRDAVIDPRLFEFDTGTKKLLNNPDTDNPLNDTLDTLKKWVLKQFREYEGLYRDNMNNLF